MFYCSRNILASNSLQENTRSQGYTHPPPPVPDDTNMRHDNGRQNYTAKLIHVFLGLHDLLIYLNRQILKGLDRRTIGQS
ncbi:hypothetical protein HYDPIDRAFT_106059, partial [Hydnomerulius pinastri MD-312]